MTRKDYEAIAKIIKLSTTVSEVGPFKMSCDVIVVDVLVGQLCDHFALDNPAFSETKFRQAIQP